MSQKRNFPQILACAIPLRFHTGWLQFFRSGTSVQAVLPLSSISTSMFRPLRSTVVTRFFATMGLSDSRQEPVPGYLFPLTVCAPVGLPGSSTDLSTRAAPSHPEQPGDCLYPLLHRRFQASSSSADWPLLPCVTRPIRVRFFFSKKKTAARVFASQGFASRIAPTRACSATCRTGN
jgi:hypothetical protein